MALTEAQREQLWQNMAAAEGRSYYFAEIASCESTKKRWITGGTFVLGSAVVVSILSKVPEWWSVLFSLLIAGANGYQIAVGQDGKIKAAAKLHNGWLRLTHDYERLWSHWHDEDAEATLDQCLEYERDLSETGATEIGYNEKRWKYWLDIAHKKHDTYTHDRQQESTATAATA